MLIAEYSLKDYREITEEHYCLRMGNLSGIKWLGERGGGGGGNAAICTSPLHKFAA